MHRRFRVAGEPHFALGAPKSSCTVDRLQLAIARTRCGEVRVGIVCLKIRHAFWPGCAYINRGDPMNRIHGAGQREDGTDTQPDYETSRVAGGRDIYGFSHAKLSRRRGPGPRAEVASWTVAALANAVFLMGQRSGLIKQRT